MPRRLYSLVLGLICFAAQELSAAEAVEVKLERGVLSMTALNDLNLAKAQFREVIEQPGVPPRVAAEALWHMADAYRRQGSDDVALQVLRKITSDFPQAFPFNTAAAKDAVTLSRTLGLSIGFPNPADAFTAQDLCHCLLAALRLDAKDEANAILADLERLYGSILFELSLNDTDEEDRTKRERETEQTKYRQFQTWTRQLTSRLTSSSAQACLTDEARRQLRDMTKRNSFRDEDFLKTIYQAQDTLVSALATADQKETASAANALLAVIKPLTEGPESLGLTMSMMGVKNTIARVVEAVESNDPRKALAIWRKGRLAYLTSSSTGQGLSIQNDVGIPAEARPAVVGALMFVESALYTVMHEEDMAPAIDDLDIGLERLTNLRSTARDPLFRKRLDQSLHTLKEARECLKSDDSSRAEELLNTEIYVTK